ncbi:hypothetical protein SAMN02745135_01161 [Caloranaerobacter azorensis DSM 13643]|uniref:LSM domain-containing protein n=1 Tax=Caloranaerobacter azorensis DSM 13643 TaxID=1121264 RepID=A0A1M5TVY8_9FIRM|nr:hypothetical protein [Caloranaerobacter azorensis]SHH54790.1 hypothetical protein SAMN02745135_01161 [Caloranaerobacter azorensis DSM 13643]
MRFSKIPQLDYGKKIKVTFIDGQVLIGIVNGFTARGDSENNLEELTIKTDQYPYVGFNESEVKKIEIID